MLVDESVQLGIYRARHTSYEASVTRTAPN